MNSPVSSPLARLRHHVSGAIARGEAQAVTEIRPTAHTPGPWALTNDNCAIVGADGGTLVVETTRAFWANLAASAAQGSTLAERHLPEVDANARLIAAAPELLAALESAHNAVAGLVTLCAQLNMESSKIAARCTLNEIEAAIAKAKGVAL